MTDNRGYAIRETALAFILGVSSQLHPREFTGQLRAEGRLITEILVIPASTYGEDFAETRLDMIPIDRSIVGSVHSHPVRSFRPSEQDLSYFARAGDIHLICRYPYRDESDVAAYSRMGERIELTVSAD